MSAKTILWLLLGQTFVAVAGAAGTPPMIPLKAIAWRSMRLVPRFS